MATSLINVMCTLYVSGTWEIVPLLQVNLLLIVVGFIYSKLVRKVKLIDLKFALLPRGILR